MWWCFSLFRHDPSQHEHTAIDRANDESLKVDEEEEAKTRFEKSNMKGKRKQEDVNPPPSICNGCNSAIDDGIYITAFDVVWHPLCLCCLHCHKPIATNEIPNSKGQFHKPCYKEHRNSCYVCEKKMPSTENRIEYNAHPFWEEKYCPCHDNDGTAKCCSCERLESCGTKYVMLEDGRWLCLECMECAVMDTVESHHLHLEIREFFESIHMKIDKEFPLLLVEKEALNKAEKEEKIDNRDGTFTRGICLSEGQMVNSVTKWPRMDREPKKLERKSEVTAILILYGFPKFLTGYILAHEMMHAWLRLNGYMNLNTVLEEGLCQVLGHMWLEPQTYATTDIAAATDASSASSSSSRTPPATTTLKKRDPSPFEKKLVGFCKYQIETDDSLVYGVGFKRVYQMMESNHYNLKDTLKDIVSISKTTQNFCTSHIFYQ